MNRLFDFVGVSMAIAISVGLALWLEWLTLRGFMRLMPATRPTLKPEPAAIAPFANDRQPKAAWGAARPTSRGAQRGSS
jgi:hypothetical protein